MLAKLTSKNQLTLPKSIISDFPDTKCFVVSNENGRIVLTPVNSVTADKVREKMTELGITEYDIASAIKWYRQKKII